MNNNLLGNVADVWRLTVDYMRDRREAARAMSEFNSLDRNEASRVLAEAGLGVADFRDVVSRPFAFEDLTSKGMASVGIESREFAVRNGDWFRSIERNCAVCRVRGHCRKVLADSEFADRFHEFCPNSADFDQILADRAGAVPPSGNLSAPDPVHAANIN